MVFANLDPSEREAFFHLLDEYFTSRPQYATSHQSASTSQPVTPTQSAVQQRMNSAVSAAGVNMLRNATAPKFLHSALDKHLPPSSSPQNNAPAAGPAVVTSSSRVNVPSGLTNSKTTFGNAVMSVGGKKNVEPVRGLATPQVVHSTPLPPPPVRGGGSRPPPAAPIRQEPTAVALYDYTSQDPGDLPFQEGEVIQIVEKISDDWWRGTSNGREGIFPSNYVQEN